MCLYFQKSLLKQTKKKSYAEVQKKFVHSGNLLNVAQSVKNSVSSARFFFSF